jgi:acyl carrier protein
VVEFVGRADAQVKVNGYRVEPEEVAAVLRAHPEVSAAEVVTDRGLGGVPRLVGYAVLHDGTVTGRELREWARDRVPDHLVPARIITLDRFPLTTNGKLDRTALVELGRSSESAPTVNGVPRTPLERFLCEMWAEVLMLDEVGVDDDFFELGGHSLVAADLLGRLEHEFGVELDARTFYLSPTIAELAESDELRALSGRIDAPSA